MDRATGRAWGFSAVISVICVKIQEERKKSLVIGKNSNSNRRRTKMNFPRRSCGRLLNGSVLREIAANLCEFSAYYE
jgi:hypothetical protein